MEIDKQKMEAAAARKRNLELAGIAIFIPIFLFVIFSWVERKLNQNN
jgi:hypothetical protein